MAARFTDRSPAPTTTRSRARSCWARCARRWRRSWPTASWWWWRASSSKEPKTKEFRKTLDKLNAKGTTLLVESSASGNQNLHLSSRNLEGVELVAGNQVHPYHLLRYESAIFARPALEKLQDSLKATAPKRKAEVA